MTLVYHHFKLFLSIVLLIATAAIHAVAQCQFSITHTANSDHCIYAEEDVVWVKSSKVNVTITGNTITKNFASGSLDAGAASVNTVKNNGWATMTIDTAPYGRVFGLSSTGPHINNLNGIQYAIYIFGNNNLGVYESGTSRTLSGSSSYNAGDVLKIWIDKGVVKYYNGNNLIYTSSVSPPASLVVDALIGSNGGTVANVKVTTGTDGAFVASLPAGDQGSGVGYEWFLNGTTTGVTTSTYTNTALNSSSGPLTCRLTQTGGCSTTATSNAINFQVASPTVFGSYYVLSSELANACLQAAEPMTAFQSVHNLNVTGNSLRKVTGTNGTYDAGAQSVGQVQNNGYVQITVAEVDKDRSFGLASTNTSDAITSIKYGFNLRPDSKLQVIDQGVLQSGLLDYSPGDILKVAIENNIVKLYRGATGTTLAYISATTPVTPLRVDVAFSSLNATLNNIIVGNGTDGTFTATASPVTAGASYQWIVNGVTQSATAATYTNPTSGNSFSCVITPGQVGCTLTTPAINVTSRPYGDDFYISNSVSAIACAETEEQVKFTDLINVTASGNSVTKVQGGNGFWNAGATSLNIIKNNGYAQMTVGQITNAHFGISSKANATIHSNPDNTTIEFSFALSTSGNTFRLKELTSVSSYIGTYNIGDILRIKIDNGVVKYYQNGSLIQTSSTAPASEMVVDVSLNDQSPAAVLSNVVVSNGTTGVFLANVTSTAGPSPAYTWKVNTNPVSTGGPSYSSDLLTLNEIVTCEMIPDITGCSTPEISNNIKVIFIGGAASPSTTWLGGSGAWETASKWDNGVPKGYTKVIINSGSPVINSDAGAYDLTIGSAASLTISASNSLTVFDKWNNSGSFTANASHVKLVNCANNKGELKGPATAETFYDLTIQNPNGIDSYNDQTISHLLALKSGVVTTQNTNDTFSINSGATVTDASSTSFIDGYVKKTGSSSFRFPIGDTYKDGSNVVHNYYRDLQITLPGPALATDAFTARYYKASSLTKGLLMDPLFYTISGCEYWELRKNNGTTDATVTLHWVSADCPGPLTYVTALSDLRVARLDDSALPALPANFTWQNKGNTATSGVTGNGYITSQVGVGSYGFFTLASVSNSNTLPIELIDFSAQPLNNSVLLSWQTLTELENDHFEVEHSDDGLEFSLLSKVSGAGTSHDVKSYQFTDYSPVAGKNYYRIKQVDTDGNSSWSKVLRVDFYGEKKPIFYPNPVKQGNHLYVTSSTEYVSLVDAFNHKSEKKVSKEGYIDTSDLPPGIYAISDKQYGVCKIVIY